jgi:hypothetical protein
MLPILAYRLQENEYGGLKSSTRARLRKLAQMLEKDPTACVAPTPQIKPGTRLLRQWRGDTHVIVEDGGYQYRGKRFDSNSGPDHRVPVIWPAISDRISAHRSLRLFHRTTGKRLL